MPTTRKSKTGNHKSQVETGATRKRAPKKVPASDGGVIDAEADLAASETSTKRKAKRQHPG